ncbi:MAG: glycosyltransferase family 39 protein [Thermodesulfobacteriota bacterium]
MGKGRKRTAKKNLVKEKGRAGTAKEARPPAARPRWLGPVLIAVLLLAAAVRVGLLDVPFERDEGEYAYAGQLILQGVPPFAEAYNMKMPGIYAAYALLLAVFGQTHAGVRLGVILINAVTTVLLYLGFRRRFDNPTSLLAACGFALVSLNPSVHGFIANAEHFVLIFIAGALYVLFLGLDARRTWLHLVSGLLLGMAFLMKQHAMFFIMFAGLYLLWSTLKQPRAWSYNVRSYVLFSAGVFLPFLGACLFFQQAGLFDRFWFWTFSYAREYVSQSSLSEAWVPIKNNGAKMLRDFSLVWVWAVIGLISPWWDQEARERKAMIYGLAFFSLVSTCPGLYFRPHYFLLLLPALGLLAALGMTALGRKLPAAWSGQARGLILTVMALSAGLWQFWMQGALFFQKTPAQIVQQLYWANPFTESLEIARYIRQHSSETDKVAVLGSEPQIYFYARRRAATGYIYTYPLMEDQKFAARMQEEMIAQIEAARPKFIVVVNVPWSWAVKRTSEPKILMWGERYLIEHYEAVGRVDIYPPSESKYVWGQEARYYRHISRIWVDLYERKT